MKTYFRSVRWSEEDKCFIGRCPELFLGGIHGDNFLKVWKELEQVIKEYLTLEE